MSEHRQLSTSEPSEPYSPDAIRYWLLGRCPACRWSMLESAVEGATGASGHGSGSGDRLALAGLKIDLERAADALPAHWLATRLILRKQHRQRRGSGLPAPDESQDPAQAIEDAIWRMATFLGWRPVSSQAA